MMKRREFIALLGGIATWPLAALAQQGGALRRMGVLTNNNSDDPIIRARLAAFLEGMASLGWTSGRTIQIDIRWPAGNVARARQNAMELAALAPDVIFATGSSTVAPLLEATRSVPIVFVIVPDPVGAGFVDSLSRPGGNATGFMQFEYNLSGKWLELLKQIAPSVTRAAVLRDAAITAGIGHAGGLVSYGTDFIDQFRLAAGYVDRILKGDKPADLPVQAPTMYELVINLKTAKALGLDVPPTVLARATAVVE